MLEYGKILKELNAAIVKYETSKDKIISEYPQQVRINWHVHMQERLDKVFKIFEQEARAHVQKLDACIKRLRAEQAHFSKIALRKMGNFPNQILLGQNSIGTKTLELPSSLVPLVHKFPFEKGFCGDDCEKGSYFTTLLLIRLLSVSPLNKLHLTLIDGDSLGKNFKHMRLLYDNDFIYKKRILTYNDEIKVALKDMADYMETILQNQLTRYDSWAEYNDKNKKSILPLKVLVIFGFNEEYGIESILYLNRIVKFGIECGILPIIIKDKSIDEIKNPNKNLKEILINLKNLNNIDNFLNATMPNLQALNLEPNQEKLPSENELFDFLNSVNEFYREDSHIKYNISDLLNKHERWSKKSINGINIPIARDMQEQAVYFEIGAVDSEHHTLIGGRSGSGKSNMLHTMITSMCFYYSPDELELFLLDYKEGVEFNIYTNPPLSHASLIAVHSDVQYGQSFLEHIVGLKNQRADIFKDAGVKDFKEYREKTGKKLSRLVIIIDEFQVLLNSNFKSNESIRKLFVEILRKGRSYGIHLVLSTQSLRGLDIGEMQSQIGNRIALVMNTDDCAKILGGDNTAPSKLSGKPYGIFNYQAGIKEGNILAVIPYADEESIRQVIAQGEKSNQRNENKIYDGDEQILLPKQIARPANIVTFGVVNNYAQNDLEIDLNRGRNIAICGRGNKEKIYDILALNLNNKPVYCINANKSLLPKNFMAKDKSIFESIDKIKEDSFVIIDNYDLLKELNIAGYNPLPDAKHLENFLNQAHDKNINLIVFVERVKETMTGNKILGFIDHFVGLNVGNNVGTILDDQNLAPIFAHKNFYFNKLYGEITEFKPYGII